MGFVEFYAGLCSLIGAPGGTLPGASRDPAGAIIHRWLKRNPGYWAQPLSGASDVPGGTGIIRPSPVIEPMELVQEDGPGGLVWQRPYST